MAPCFVALAALAGCAANPPRFEVIDVAMTEQSSEAVVKSAVKATTAAAVVDLCLVPRRLTPGFERRLSGRSLWLVYGGLALGMTAGALLLQGSRR